MTISASSPIENAYAPANAQNLKSESQQITEKNAQNVHQKVEVEVLKETLEAEKATAGTILDMLA